MCLKGLTDPDSVKLTMYILCRMIPLHQSEEGIEHLHIILLLMACILVLLDDLDSDTLNAVRSFSEFSLNFRRFFIEISRVESENLSEDYDVIS